jgi:hypothetical protein
MIAMIRANDIVAGGYGNHKIVWHINGFTCRSRTAAGITCRAEAARVRAIVRGAEGQWYEFLAERIEARQKRTQQS